MGNGIKIEAREAPLTADSVQALAEGFASILEAGFNSHADQTTIQVALKGFADITSRSLVNGTTISNCHLTTG